MGDHVRSLRFWWADVRIQVARGPRISSSIVGDDAQARLGLEHNRGLLVLRPLLPTAATRADSTPWLSPPGHHPTQARATKTVLHVVDLQRPHQGTRRRLHECGIRPSIPLKPHMRYCSKATAISNRPGRIISSLVPTSGGMCNGTATREMRTDTPGTTPVCVSEARQIQLMRHDDALRWPPWRQRNRPLCAGAGRGKRAALRPDAIKDHIRAAVVTPSG
jgi:hypothetical protein